jgi:hypothetical protein
MTILPGPVPEIRGVLDRSALQSYANGHVHIGEIIREVADEDNVAVAIPAAALAEAHADNFGDDHARELLVLVTTLPGTTVLDLNREVAGSIAGALRLTHGDVSRAQAVWTANKHRALLFTTEPGDVKSMVPSGNIIAISAEDA